MPVSFHLRFNGMPGYSYIATKWIAIETIKLFTLDIKQSVDDNGKKEDL